ncbi:MAG: hypothetical protein NTX75_02835 [Proteobacteria bacterium]|nr:hypothetical protein [Pseudomonadota bacterium]
MIKDEINKDISEEFIILRKELQIYLRDDFLIDQNRLFLQNHVPQKIINKAEILTDTLLNYLMEEAVAILQDADIDIQNSFYREDFRGRFRLWAAQVENNLRLDPSIVEFNRDPRLINGLIAGGITFITGTAVTSLVFVPTSAIAAIVSGIMILIVSAVAYKVAHKKSSKAARETIKRDIESYIKASEIQVSEWLEGVIKAFSDDFVSFCQKNGLEHKGTIA